ncbi:hypothetical protein BN2476_460131 [Paraburkholderia piptadeniae]|uniref:Uncharacterized protein n=1 Tax=Paraburkholderia piptadeniae TaxID=1701573 RepID=A0A1N7SD83_9BURK|nr:hypothetical protein BN2476_460131 [Paraburkholderia piptadeniae]
MQMLLRLLVALEQRTAICGRIVNDRPAIQVSRVSIRGEAAVQAASTGATAKSVGQ